MQDIKKIVRDSRNNDVNILLETAIKDLEKEGLSVEFGNIGERTTYAMIYNKDHTTEIVGYTFLRDLKYYKDNVGKLKALQQAIARKKIAEFPEK